MGSFNYFAFTIHMGSNCYINTGVRDLEVALFKVLLQQNNVVLVLSIPILYLAKMHHANYCSSISKTSLIFFNYNFSFKMPAITKMNT